MSVFLIAQCHQITCSRLKAWASVRLVLRLLGVLAHCVIRVYTSGLEGGDGVSLFNRRLACGRQYVDHQGIAKTRNCAFGIVAAITWSPRESSCLRIDDIHFLDP